MWPRFRVTTDTMGSKFFKVAFKIQGVHVLELSKGPLMVVRGCLKERSSTLDLRQDRLGASFSQL